MLRSMLRAAQISDTPRIRAAKWRASGRRLPFSECQAGAARTLQSESFESVCAPGRAHGPAHRLRSREAVQHALPRRKGPVCSAVKKSVGRTGSLAVEKFLLFQEKKTFKLKQNSKTRKQNSSETTTADLVCDVSGMCGVLGSVPRRSLGPGKP